MCWTLWTARNQLIFENKSPSQRETTTKALKTAREWAQAQEGLTKQHQQPITKLIPHRRQELDISDLTVCFTDAAWDKASNKAGLAWTFNQQATSMTHEGSKVSDHVSSALMAEALAIREALQSAISLDITRIKINSDNQTLIRVINSEIKDKEIYGVSQDIKIFTALFASISFNFIPRAENVRADSLAKASLRAFCLLCNGPALG
ncbi:hypothetical protein IGI04_025354 [Brassica rapa subsp. trilocularis]|uniref:RNase H type-1 domain-containing protein n=1 Tax=Brassica rapa subsp. trilocularis TaxID=1813537 RepID=A0ABQ7MD49_BRACM|nr:hypothetical protein IGI04_025354 [Brassica rapa subsp. trilocularis]